MSHDERSENGSSTSVGDPFSQVEQEERSGNEGYIRQVALVFIHNLFSVSKSVQLYQLNNDAVQRTLSDFVEVAKELIDKEGQASLRVTAESIYINNVRISISSHGAGLYFYIIDNLKKRGVEAIEFLAGLSVEDIGRFLKIFFELEENENVFDLLQERMRAVSIQNVTVVPWMDRERQLAAAFEKPKDIRSESKVVFFRTVNLMKGILQAIEQKHVIQVKKARRLTQQMTDIIQADESILLGLASIKDFDEYTYTHSVNVCILSMLTGDRLKLYKQDIARLGLAGLLHDIGKVHIPGAIINSESALSESEWELMKYHTFFGAIELARVNALSEVIDAMFVALQHHIHYDMNGYPRKPNGWDLRLFSRIVTVADYYDAMTSSRTYRKIPITPDKVLQFILEKSGRIFDPLVVKTFIQAMGIYPIGTVVELDTGERAIVMKQNPEIRYIHRPTVQLLAPSSVEEGRFIDLAKRSSGAYRFKRSIVRAIHDRDAGVDKRNCFMN